MNIFSIFASFEAGYLPLSGIGQIVKNINKGNLTTRKLTVNISAIIMGLSSAAAILNEVVPLNKTVFSVGIVVGMTMATNSLLLSLYVPPAPLPPLLPPPPVVGH